MRVLSIDGDVERGVPVFGRTVEDLRALDRGGARPRWVAVDGDTLVAGATAVRRPDDRTALAVHGDASATAALVRAAVEELPDATLMLQLPEDDHRIDGLRALGFEEEMVLEHVEVDLDAALAALAERQLPDDVTTIAARDADVERLVALDDAIRQDVPGSDGWRGDVERIRDELDDPGAYRIAVETGSEDYVGLARVWRNATGPRVGLVGVVRPRRGQGIGWALLREALTEAATWGHATLATETSVANEIVHPRLLTIGRSVRRTVQLTRSPSRRGS